MVLVLSGVCQIHGLREEKRKVSFRIGENETESLWSFNMP